MLGAWVIGVLVDGVLESTLWGLKTVRSAKDHSREIKGRKAGKINRQVTAFVTRVGEEKAFLSIAEIRKITTTPEWERGRRSYQDLVMLGGLDPNNPDAL